MSIPHINAVFAATDLEPYSRLVMLAIADRAGDDGVAFPSIQDLIARTGMVERSIQNVTKRLIEKGWLAVKFGGGRHQRNSYTITINPAGNAGNTGENPAPDAGNSTKPRTEYTAPDAGYEPETPHLVPETPHLTTRNPAPGAGEPPMNHREPEEKKEARSALDFLRAVVSDETAQAFIDHRKAKRAKLTPYAARLIAEKLASVHDPDAELRKSIMNGWTGVFPDEAKGKADEQRPGAKFGAAIHQLADRLADGSAKLDTSNRDPFAVLAKRNSEADADRPIPLLRP